MVDAEHQAESAQRSFLGFSATRGRCRPTISPDSIVEGREGFNDVADNAAQRLATGECHDPAGFNFGQLPTCSEHQQFMREGVPDLLSESETWTV